MTNQTPADELRQAAAALRQARFPAAMTATASTAALIAARFPLADWLDLAATEYDPEADVQETDRSHDAALAVARAVLGRPAVPAATSSEGEQ